MTEQFAGYAAALFARKVMGGARSRDERYVAGFRARSATKINNFHTSHNDRFPLTATRVRRRPALFTLLLFRAASRPAREFSRARER